MTTNWLERCIADEEEFFAEHWRSTPAVLRPDNPPVDVLTLTELDGLLDHGLLKVPYIGLVHADGQVPGELFCAPRVVLGELVEDYADAEAVRALVRDEQATVLLRHVDQWHQGVRELTGALAERFGRQVEAFFVRTPSEAPSGPVHRDDDILVVQVSGEQRWRVHAGPTDGTWEPAPSQDEDLGELLLDTVLRPGEVLYIPRGFAHRAGVEGPDPSAHLSLTVREAGTANLYALLQALLTDGIDLPGRPLDDAALDAAATDLISHSSRTLASLTPEALIEHARATMRADLRPTG